MRHMENNIKQIVPFSVQKQFYLKIWDFLHEIQQIILYNRQEDIFEFRTNLFSLEFLKNV